MFVRFESLWGVVVINNMFERNFEFVVVIHIIDRGFLLAKIKKKKKEETKNWAKTYGSLAS